MNRFSTCAARLWVTCTISYPDGRCLKESGAAATISKAPASVRSGSSPWGSALSPELQPALFTVKEKRGQCGGRTTLFVSASLWLSFFSWFCVPIYYILNVEWVEVTFIFPQQQYANHLCTFPFSLSGQASHFFWGLWSLIQAKFSSIDFDFLGYVQLPTNWFRYCLF